MTTEIPPLPQCSDAEGWSARLTDVTTAEHALKFADAVFNGSVDRNIDCEAVKSTVTYFKNQKISELERHYEDSMTCVSKVEQL